MSKPQKIKRPFFPVYNEVWCAMMRLAMSDGSRRVLQALMWTSFAQKRERAEDISWSELQDLTGLSRRSVSRGIEWLQEQRIVLVVVEATGVRPATYRVDWRKLVELSEIDASDVNPDTSSSVTPDTSSDDKPDTSSDVNPGTPSDRGSVTPDTSSDVTPDTSRGVNPGTPIVQKDKEDMKTYAAACSLSLNSVYVSPSTDTAPPPPVRQVLQRASQAYQNLVVGGCLESSRMTQTVDWIEKRLQPGISPEDLAEAIDYGAEACKHEITERNVTNRWRYALQIAEDHIGHVVQRRKHREMASTKGLPDPGPYRYKRGVR